MDYLFVAAVVEVVFIGALGMFALVLMGVVTTMLWREWKRKV